MHFVNCVLKCAGCDLRVTADDIEDVDNCQNRIADIQNMYIEVSPGQVQIAVMFPGEERRC